MMHALHTVVVLLALGAFDDVTETSSTANGVPVDTPSADEVAPSSVADVTLPTDSAPVETRPAVSFLGVASTDAERTLAARVDEDVRALLLADRTLVFAPSSAPVLEPACFVDDTCRTAQSAGLEGTYVVAARVQILSTAADGAESEAGVALTLVLFDRVSGRVESELSYSERDEGAVLARLAAAYASLFTAIREPAAAMAPEAPAVAEPTLDDADAVDEGLGFEVETPAARRLESKAEPVADVSPPAESLDEGVAIGTWLYMGAFVVVGAALVLSGAAFDLASPSSTNGLLDPLDAVGPSLVTVGALVAVAGVVTGLVFEPFAGSSDAEKN
jgi:hypothetical protein